MPKRSHSAPRGPAAPLKQARRLIDEARAILARAGTGARERSAELIAKALRLRRTPP